MEFFPISVKTSRSLAIDHPSQLPGRMVEYSHHLIVEKMVWLLDHPVTDHLDNIVTPPDLRKDRQFELCEELLKPKYSVHGFKTADLADALPHYFRNSTQIRYELKQLIVRGVVRKKKNKSFYVVTQLGWKWLWTSICYQR